MFGRTDLQDSVDDRHISLRQESTQVALVHPGCTGPTKSTERCGGEVHKIKEGPKFMQRLVAKQKVRGERLMTWAGKAAPLVD